MKRSIVASGIAVAAFLAPLSASADTADVPPGKITMNVVTVNGSGCPAGTAEVAPATDNTAFTVTYSNYLAQVGDDAKATDFRKNCQLVVNVHIPQGFTYAVQSADYRGYAHLERGSRALQRANYYFQGNSANNWVEHNIPAPRDDDWQNTDRTETADLVWAPCGESRNLNLNTELRVYSGSSDKKRASFLTMDSVDGAASTQYHLDWKKCN